MAEENAQEQLIERRPDTARLPSVLRWTAFEYEHSEKSPDWFWILGIIALAGAAAAAILGDVLFSLVILLAAGIMTMFAMREPDVVQFEITTKGVRINDSLRPFHTLDSFWVNHFEDDVEPLLLIKSKKLLEPLIMIPIDESEVAAEEVRAYLIRFIEEEEHEEPLSHHLMRALGF